MPIQRMTELERRWKSSMEDGKVDAREANALSSALATPGDKDFLLERLKREASLFEQGARKVLDAFFGIPLPAGEKRRDLPDPAVLEKHQRTVQYQWLDGAVFVEGADETDVKQGQLWDCYLAAALAAVAAREPKTIEEAVRDNGDGTVTVRFYDVTRPGRATPEFVTVDKQLPMMNGSPYYAKNTKVGETWVGLVEKAFAMWKGGYEAIGAEKPVIVHGPGDVISALTGRRDVSRRISERSSELSLFQQLQFALKRGASAVAGTHGEDQAALYTGTGLVSYHAYSVLDAVEENGERYLVLRNPWARREPGNDGVDDGIFRIDMKTFVKFFGSLTIA